MLTDGEATRGLARSPTQPCGEFFIKCLGSLSFITLAIDPPLIADPREMMISSKLKLNLFGEDKDSWATHQAVTSGQALGEALNLH